MGTVAAPRMIGVPLAIAVVVFALGMLLGLSLGHVRMGPATGTVLFSAAVSPSDGQSRRGDLSLLGPDGAVAGLDLPRRSAARLDGVCPPTPGRERLFAFVDDIPRC